MLLSKKKGGRLKMASGEREGVIRDVIDILMDAGFFARRDVPSGLAVSILPPEGMSSCYS
jgi:hypothetical protein